MKKMPCFIILTKLVLLFASCGNSPRNNSEYVSVNDYPISEDDGRTEHNNYTNTYDVSMPDIVNIQLSGDIVQCNKCMGYGMVQDDLNGQPQICKFCWISTYMRMQQGWTGFDGRYGQVDAVFNTLPADYFDELDWDTSNEDNDNSGGTTSEQIEDEIAQHEENVAQLEHQLEYIEGSINRSQIQQQIIEEQYEIKRLKAILNGM